MGKRNGVEVELKTCQRCRRLFTYPGFGHIYCPLCKMRDEEDYEKVKSYIYENGTASALEVSEQTGVSVRLITSYLREGRLVIPECSPIFIKCEHCGADIRSGRVCPDCAARLSAALKMEMQLDIYEVGDKPRKAAGVMHIKKRGL